MAKRKEDFSFNFSGKKAKPKPQESPAEVVAEEAPPEETPVEVPAETSVDASAEIPAEETPVADAPVEEAPAEAPAAEAPVEVTPAPEPVAEAPAEEQPVEAQPAADEPAPQPSSGPRVKQHQQFRILILADFSGRTNRSINQPDDIASRKVRNVDADNLAKVIAAIKPEIQIPVDDKTVIPLAFGAVEDFRPDGIIQQIQAFQNMLALRSQLKDNKQFKQAAAAVQRYLAPGSPGGAAKSAKSSAAKKPDAAQSEFEQLLDRPVAPPGATHAGADELIANLVAGYGVPGADPEQGKLVALVEDALSAGLRAVLRHPAFQATEGAWRGVEFLVSRLNTDEDLKLCIFDVSKDELYADLSGPPAIQKTGMYQILIEQTQAPGVTPFSLVIGDYDFDQTPANVAVLAKIAALMQEGGIPFIAAATAKLPGFASFEKAVSSGKWEAPADLAIWEKFRAHRLAPYIGLTAPRFLGRLPYGPKTDAIDAYPFNEIPAAPVSEQYLWLNGAYAVALLIGQAFLENSWGGIEPGNDVSDLPCHMAVVEGDKEMTPCAQAFLSDRVGDILHSLGLIPLLSVRNSAEIKVAGIHSVAKGKPLAAYWAT